MRFFENRVGQGQDAGDWRDMEPRTFSQGPVWGHTTGWDGEETKPISFPPVFKKVSIIASGI